MGQAQASALGLTHGENAWRSHTELQRQRNTTLLILKRSEKIEFIKWAKAFDADPLSYIRVCQGQYTFPTGIMAKVLALGYVSDISEVKRLHNDEDISVKWTPIPFGFTKEEWDSPETIKEGIMDNRDSDSDNEGDEGDKAKEPGNDSDSEPPVELGTNMNNLLEEVADDSEPEPEPEPEPDSDSEIKSLVTELPGVKIE